MAQPYSTSGRTYTSPPSLLSWAYGKSARWTLYLDATTLLPSAITFVTHVDNNVLDNISVELISRTTKSLAESRLFCPAYRFHTGRDTAAWGERVLELIETVCSSRIDLRTTLDVRFVRRAPLPTPNSYAARRKMTSEKISVH
jgi:hypothetical protein